MAISPDPESSQLLVENKSSPRPRLVSRIKPDGTVVSVERTDGPDADERRRLLTREEILALPDEPATDVVDKRLLEKFASKGFADLQRSLRDNLLLPSKVMGLAEQTRQLLTSHQLPRFEAHEFVFGKSAVAALADIQQLSAPLMAPLDLIGRDLVSAIHSPMADVVASLGPQVLRPSELQATHFLDSLQSTLSATEGLARSLIAQFDASEKKLFQPFPDTSLVTEVSRMIAEQQSLYSGVFSIDPTATGLVEDAIKSLSYFQTMPFEQMLAPFFDRLQFPDYDSLFLPDSPMRLVDTLHDVDASDQEKLRAAEQLARRIRWRPTGRAHAGLLEYANDRDVSPETAKREMLQAAVFFAFSRGEEPQYVRYGRRWLKSGSGQRALIVPFEDLPVDLYMGWIWNQIRVAAEASVLDEPYPASGRDILSHPEKLKVPRPASDDEEPIEIADSSADPLESLLIAEQASENRRRVLVLLDRSSRREKELLSLLLRGFSREDAAQIMGVAPATVRAMLKHVRDKAA